MFMEKQTHLRHKWTVNLLQYVVHLEQLGLDEWTVGSANMTDVVQAQVVEDQDVPVVSLKGAVQVAGHVVVDLYRIRNNSDISQQSKSRKEKLKLNHLNLQYIH